MDGQRFDRWTRSLARGQSRRSVLRLIGAGTAGAALSVLGVRGGAGAQACLGVGRACTSDGQCCGEFSNGRCETWPNSLGTYCGPVSQPIGGPCTTAFDCSGGLCFSQCVNNICEAYCHAEGVGCRNCGTCCPGLVCDTSVDPLVDDQVCVREFPTTPPPTTAPPTTAPPTTAPPRDRGEAARQRAEAARQRAAELRAAAEARAEEARRSYFR